MSVFRRVLHQIPLYLAWIVISFIFWGWIFTLTTDTVPEKKVTLLVSAPALEDRALAAALEEELPEGIRMVKVHPFSYAVFDESHLSGADLYLVPASQIPEYEELFAHGIRGIPVAGAAGRYISYAPGEEYFLFYGKNSCHRADGAALAVAERLLGLE